MSATYTHYNPSSYGNPNSSLFENPSDQLMDQIETAYIHGDFDLCLSLIDRRFTTLRTHFPQNQQSAYPRLLHSCSRHSDCDCAPLTSYLLALAFHQQEPDTSHFLEQGGFLHEPHIRMPFKQFSEWVQMEAYRGGYQRADEMIRGYIFESSRLRGEGEISSGKQEQYKGLFGGFGGARRHGGLGSGGFGVNTRDLPLGKEEYNELLELLVFHVLLPWKGFKQTVKSMKDLPMTKSMRSAFEQRLIDLRNTAVADLKLTNAEKIISLNTISTNEKPNKSENPTQEANMSKEATHVKLDNTIETSKKDTLLAKHGKKLKQGILIAACVMILYALLKSGLPKYLITEVIWRSRLMKWIMLVLFNYKIGNPRVIKAGI